MTALCFDLFYLSLPLQDKKGLSTAILIVYLDSAFNLPVSTNPMQQPSLLTSFFWKQQINCFKYSFTNSEKPLWVFKWWMWNKEDQKQQVPQGKIYILLPHLQNKVLDYVVS